MELKDLAICFLKEYKNPPFSNEDIKRFLRNKFPKLEENQIEDFAIKLRCEIENEKLRKKQNKVHDDYGRGYN